ncbi:plasmid mobilization protein [uncultured Robinsoniella sp.]|uniref:plasmid mobilization protein n=1 Tax=uncultured Robinsoniella sp. TaxID=904190 RepID=UPI00374EE25A
MANRKRNKSVAVRVTETEQAQIKRRIEQSKLSQQDYFLSCLLNKEIHVKEDGLEVVMELKRIGNNVNQIAYKANAGQIHDCSEELRQIYSELREIRIIWQ